jgi:hypothetical protein
MNVLVNCKNCHRDFNTGISVLGTEALKNFTIDNNDIPCPFCMETRTYNSTDYFLQQ